MSPQKTLPISTRFVSLALSILVLFGLLAPLHVQAEKPTPETPAETETPALVAGQLLGPPAAPSGCTTDLGTFTSTPNLPIPDFGVITATLNVSGVGISIWDVNLTTNLAHTYNSDLDVYLISPEGTEVTLTTDNGAGNDNVFNGTIWDDQWVGTSVTDYTYADNTVVPALSPEEAMGAFIGEDPNGTWKLVIHDDAGDDTGTLASWGLDFITLNVDPHTLSGSGFAYPNAPIPDNGTYTSSVNLTTLEVGEIWVYTTIEHPSNRELDVYLVSPAGITITLTSDNGGTFQDGFAGTRWDDQGGAPSGIYSNPPGPVTDNVFEDGVYETPLVAENALAAFNGTEGNGTWTLVVKDDTPGNTGVLTSWGILLSSYTCLMDMISWQYESHTPLELGEPITYQINISNVGLTPAPGVIFTDTLPAGGSFLDWTSPDGWACTLPPVGGTGTITCSADSVAAGETVPFTLELAPLDVPQWLPNQIEVSTSGPETFTFNNLDYFEIYTGLLSDNGNPWDLYDGLRRDNGGVARGGQEAFASLTSETVPGYGMLRLRVLDGANTLLTDNAEVSGFDLTFDGGRGWSSANAPVYSDVAVSREVYAPADANYLRYLDTFTNTSNAVRQVQVAWGGELGSLSWTTLAADSSGNLTLNTADTWAVTTGAQPWNPTTSFNPPVGYLLRDASDTSYTGTGNFFNNPFETPWAGYGDSTLAHLFSFTLEPGETAHLIYFLYRGLAEETYGPEGCTTNCITPPGGSELALAQTALTALAAAPDVCNLPSEVLANVVNWPGLPACNFSIFLPTVVR